MRAFAGWRDWTEPTVRHRPIGLIAIAIASAAAGIAVLLASIELFASAAAYRDWTEPSPRHPW